MNEKNIEDIRINYIYNNDNIRASAVKDAKKYLRSMYEN